MSYELSDTERNAALQLNADYRFDHFISKLVEHEELFVLTDEHGVMMLTTEEEDCIPVWPHPDYAKAWAEGEWAECKPQSITLKVWLDRWVDGMEQDDLCVAVFPTPDQEGIVLDPADVAAPPLRKSRPNAAECPLPGAIPVCNKDPPMCGVFFLGTVPAALFFMLVGGIRDGPGGKVCPL